MSTTFTLPMSGEVLSHLIEAFDLRRFDRADVLSTRNGTTVRFLRGERVGDDAEAKIWCAAAAALLSSDLLPRDFKLEPPLVPGAEAILDLVPQDVIIGHLLERLAEHWDELGGALRRLSAPVCSERLAWVGCLQLIAVDLAVRLTAVLWLTRSSIDAPEPIAWAEKHGVQTWLREMLRRAGVTRDEMAAGARVHAHTVDGWLDGGARPNDDNLQDIAAVLAPDAGERESLLRDLRLSYGLRSLFEQVVEAVGEEHARPLAERLVGYSCWMINVPRASKRSVADNDSKMNLTVFVGTLGRGAGELPWVEHMLNSVWRIEPDAVWRTSIKASTRSWFERLQAVAASLPPASTEAWQHYFGSVPPPEVLERIRYSSLATKLELARDPRMAMAMDLEVEEGGYVAGLELKLRGVEASNAGDLLGAINLFRSAISEDPLNAEIRFRLGACLWQVGDVKGGLDELEIAAQIEPSWDRVHVEIGIILLNLDQNEEAVTRLQAARALFPQPSTWLLLHLGCAQERAGLNAEAIATYDELIGLDEHHAEALDRLAHLYLRLGRKREGAALAKRAAHLGFTDVFDAWEGGFYERRPAGGRPPRTTRLELIQLGDNRALKPPA